MGLRQVVQFRQYGQSPANGVEAGSVSPWQQHTKLTQAGRSVQTVQAESSQWG